jgi:hypothetical protein
VIHLFDDADIDTGFARRDPAYARAAQPIVSD